MATMALPPWARELGGDEGEYERFLARRRGGLAGGIQSMPIGAPQPMPDGGMQHLAPAHATTGRRSTIRPASSNINPRTGQPFDRNIGPSVRARILAESRGDRSGGKPPQLGGEVSDMQFRDFRGEMPGVRMDDPGVRMREQYRPDSVDEVKATSGEFAGGEKEMQSRLDSGSMSVSDAVSALDAKKRAAQDRIRTSIGQAMAQRRSAPPPEIGGVMPEPDRNQTTGPGPRPIGPTGPGGRPIGPTGPGGRPIGPIRPSANDGGSPPFNPNGPALPMEPGTESPPFNPNGQPANPILNPSAAALMDTIKNPTGSPPFVPGKIGYPNNGKRPVSTPPIWNPKGAY